MMVVGLGALGFINPSILGSLIFLPALWFLLRVTPPAPRLVRFPPARFFAGLYPDERTASQTPWWILLLRLLAVSLIIVALSRPVLNPAAQLPGAGPVRLVMDNGWASAQTWQMQKKEAAALIDRAGRERREIYILTTAPEPGKDKPVQHGPLAQGAAESVLNGLKPYPWPSSYTGAAAVIDGMPVRTSITSFWMSTGLRDGNAETFARALQNQGELSVIMPEDAQLPVLLRPGKAAGMDLRAVIETAAGAAAIPVTAQVLGKDGSVLDSIEAPPGKASTEIVFDLPEPLLGHASQVRLAGRSGAGAVLLLDQGLRRRNVGIVAPAGQEDTAPLIEESFYLRRALEPYAHLSAGPVTQLLEKKPAAIILPDTGALPPEELNALEEWVRKGGLLMRFAGPNMTQGEAFLTPVPLRKGGRAMDGALTWDKPAALAPFPRQSPFFGLEVTEDIVVNRQILAEPVEGMEKMTWAALADGTPLITAKALDDGLLVFVHTTATPLWSDLALSGLFVQILQRTVNLAGQPLTQTDVTGALDPLVVLDGFGNLRQPDASTLPVNPPFENAEISSSRPPGIYGRPGFSRAFNTGDRLPALKTMGALPAGVEETVYGGGSEKELMPRLLLAAFCLFLLDWLIMIVMQAGFLTRRWRHAAAAFALCLIMQSPAQAATEEEMIRYAGDLHLAYIRTGSAQADQAAHAGLQALLDVLTRRTSVEPAGIVGLNPATDELSFFPFIYWPVSSAQQALPAEALRRVQDYLDHGGTILFDTRDRHSTPAGSSAGGNAGTLRLLVGGLNIPPLVPAPADHVLTKSFYLLKGFPERYDAGNLWVEENSASGRDGVSSVIIANNDWASAWAGSGRDQEIALRFGVNTVIYALTGNYKADQVHLPHILERLGQ